MVKKGNCTLLPACHLVRNYGGCDKTFGVNGFDITEAIPKADVLENGMEITPDMIAEDLNTTRVAICHEPEDPSMTPTCECLPGRYQDQNSKAQPGTNCTPVNNCLASNRGGCHVNATCIYSGPGTNLCMCNKGFKGNGKEGDGSWDPKGAFFKGCVAINPCEEGTDGCSNDACCTYLGPPLDRNGKQIPNPLYGSKAFPSNPSKAVGEVHNCTCNPGFRGNGTFCKELCTIGPADCIHGSEPNPNMTSGLDEDCNCVKCEEPWQGELCDTCMYNASDCKNEGQFNAEHCRCENCTAPWGGLLCDECQRTNEDCINGGYINEETCECEGCSKYRSPPGPDGKRGKPIDKWAGALCDVCLWTEDTCYHSSIKDQKLLKTGGDPSSIVSTIRTEEQVRMNQFKVEECVCKNCSHPWKGELCEVCGLENGDCTHGGRLDKANCRCVECNEPWTGRMCSTCSWQKLCNAGSPGPESCPCKHGSKLDPLTCTCIDGEGPWGGPTFEECQYEKQDCNKGILSKKLCKCIVCPKWWTGDLCDTCARNQTFYKNGGQFDADACACKDCIAPWSGDLCDICNRDPMDCENGSELDVENCTCVEPGKKECPRGYTGATCGGCTLKQSDCLNNGVLNKEACMCEECEPWGGKRCSVCTLKDQQCGHGTIADKVNCQCKHSQGTPAKPCGPNAWGGVLCNICQMLETDCQHGSILNKKKCRCVKNAQSDICPNPWKGIYCEACSERRLFENDVANCQNGGKLDRQKCQCVGCDEGWAGAKCSVCNRKNVDCKNGAALDPELCRCSEPNGVGCPMPWVGPYCDKCALTAKSCKAGTFDATSCKCICPEGHKGLFCQISAACPKNCNGKGKCVKNTCQCNPGWGSPSLNSENPCSVKAKRTGWCYSVGDPHPRTFDGFRFDTYERGEFVYYKDTIDPFEEEVHVTHTMLRNSDRSGVSGLALRYKESPDSTGRDTVVVTSCTGSQWCNRDFSVSYNCDWHAPDGSSWHDKAWRWGGVTFPNGIYLNLRNMVMENKKTGLYINWSNWGGWYGSNRFTRMWNLYVRARLPRDGRARGYCGNFDGNRWNDRQFVEESLSPSQVSSPRSNTFHSSSQLSVNMDYGKLDTSEYGYGKQSQGPFAATQSWHNRGGGNGRYRSIMQCKDGPNGHDIKQHVCFDCPAGSRGRRGNSLNGILDSKGARHLLSVEEPEDISTLQLTEGTSATQGRKKKPCNVSVPMNGKTDIEVPDGPEKPEECARPDTPGVVPNFMKFAECECSTKDPALVAVTTCAPCCPGSAKAKKAAKAGACCDCIQDFCGTGSAMMANLCANVQDDEEGAKQDEESEKKEDAAEQQSADHAAAQQNANAAITATEEAMDGMATNEKGVRRRLL